MSSIRTNCRKVVCVGRNYVDHILELSSPRPKNPLFFLKPPSSILPAAAAAAAKSTTTTTSSSATIPQVIRPRGVTLHHEVELGLIIGRRLKNFHPSTSTSSSSSSSSSSASKDDISTAISGYCLAIDMTARNVQNAAARKGLPWTVAKGFDTFCPVSAVIPTRKMGSGFLTDQSLDNKNTNDDTPATTNSDGEDDETIKFWLRVDGVEKQRGDPRSMIFKIPTLLAHITRVMTLEEGDLVLTGTPCGVGPVLGGQTLRCGIELGGRPIEEGAVELVVRDAEEREGGYEFKE